MTIQLSGAEAQLNCRPKILWYDKDGSLMAEDSDHQFHQPGERDVAEDRLLRRSGGIGRSLYRLAGLICARSALVVAIAVNFSVGCASSSKVAAVNSERQGPTPHVESSPATEALDRHTGQMAEEDQRRAAQAYKRVPARSRHFRDEPIRPSPRP